jgi:hypothetical protein
MIKLKTKKISTKKIKNKKIKKKIKYLNLILDSLIFGYQLSE